MSKYKISPKDPRSAYLQLYTQLRDDITRGIYAFGGRLPSKRTLAADTGTSVITTDTPISSSPTRATSKPANGAATT